MTTVGVTDLSLIDILMAQRHLFPDIRWTTFRYNYLRSTEQYDDRDNLFSGDDYTPDVMKVLDSQRLKEFLFFDDTKGAYRCPHCLEGRNQSDDEREFVQLTGMRRAMVNYMNDKGDPLNAYPAFWGPFSVVGEGAAK